MRARIIVVDDESDFLDSVRRGLITTGFKNVYTIIDGFEGDKVKDPESVFNGKRMKNGWKHSAPWVYDIDPEKLILEEGTSKQT